MKVKSLIGSLAILASVVGSAHAAPLSLFSGVNIFEDDNREYEVNKAGGVAGVLEVGDRLRGVIKFSAILEEAGVGEIDPINPELTGLFDTEIKAIIPVPGSGPTIIWGPATTGTFTTTYGPTAMVALFTGGSSLSLNGCLTIAACEAAATDGALYAIAGFGDADDQWFSTNSNLNIGAVSQAPGSSKAAFINYALSILVNNTGYAFGEQKLFCGPNSFNCNLGGNDMTDLIGSGDVLGGRGLTNGYQARSDIDVQLNVIPEPGSLALVSLALVGLGFVGRRRQSAA